ncbi:hypothetical protein PR048_022806 [Dryococelus australis]|uniref:Major facilitator superfamily (MFS) profile domain-containing protein n=1 Tax=Dryococelus australis TaxID=614101 RepID=A0ABQ9GS99_9NEOP|nr:hypothetical protein PR048_022806 [Dryococelus australis]
MHVGLLFTGFVASGSCIISTLYIVETVDDDIRGTMGSMINLFICMGVLFSYVVASYVTYLTFNILCLAIMVSFVLAFWWMPETPAYLDSIGQHVEAEKTRKWLRLKAKSPVKEAIILERSNDESANEKSFLAELLSNRGARKAIIIGIGLVLNNQLSGITAVVSYSVTIFQASGSVMSPNISAIVVGALQLSAVYLTTFLIDRVGRKVLLLGSNITITVCLTSLGLFFYLKNHNYDVNSLGWVPIVSLCVFVIAFAMGSGTIALVVISEIFPPHVKDVAVTFCICFLNFMAFLVTRFFMSLIQVLGMSGCFWFFAACCLASVFFCQFVVPETKNRSIESILAELNGEAISDVKLQKAIMI